MLELISSSLPNSVTPMVRARRANDTLRNVVKWCHEEPGFPGCVDVDVHDNLDWNIKFNDCKVSK